MLTPSEALGLSGAALATRIRRALHQLPTPELARIQSKLRESAMRNDVVYEHAGVFEPVRIMTRPLLVMPEQVSYLHHVCAKLTEALKRLPELYFADSEVRQVLRMRDDEHAFLSELWTDHHARFNPVYGRLDAVCDFESASWQHSLWFMEPNLSGVGGIHLAPVAESLVMHDVVPSILAHDPQLSLALPRDQRDLLFELLLEHAEAIGSKGRVIAMIEPKYSHEGPNEQSVLARFLAQRHHAQVHHVDPRELEARGDEVHVGGVPVDVAYRDYEIRDLLELERNLGRPLEAMRLLFRQNRMVSSLAGDFDHKSCWELFTDDDLAARLFSSEERRAFHKHVLWTRVVSARNTSLPKGAGDLPTFIRDHREDLVLKRNRGYGGSGVCVGASVSQSDWETRLHEALLVAHDAECSWVVQAATRLPVYEFPGVDESGRVHDEPYYAVMGFAATDAGLGVLCRVSQRQVVNVAQHGGLAVTLVGQPPSELRVSRRPFPGDEQARLQLRARIRELRHLDQAIGLLGWDEETYLPEAGRRGRGAQIGTIETLRHQLLSSDELGDLLAHVAPSVHDDRDSSRELHVLGRLRRTAQALPDTLVRAHAEARSACLAAWEQARECNDYGVFAPAFATLLGLVRERATLLARGVDPFDAVLDEHEPGMTRARIEPVLLGLRERLTALVERAKARTEPEVKTLRGIRFPEAKQWQVCRELLAQMGFSFARGRLDRSTHPFTLAAGGDDVRLTICVQEDDLTRALFATLHEGGHGLFDQAFRPEDRDSLLADAPSMGLHEAHARLWENVVGRSRAFWDGFFPILRQHFPDQLRGFDAEAAYRAVNVVAPGLHRVSADEVTYNLHILLRHELEVELLSGNLPVHDVPAAWAAKSQAYFGLLPKTVTEGCLQDVHWALGTFGYFPTYTLGDLYAAQLAATYAGRRDLSGELARHELSPFSDWMRQHVSQLGQRVGAEENVRQVTGVGLDATAFLDALEQKHCR